ncbi:MAG TPA: hypothetical protein PKD85_23890, partial [Saprospiraceae bacterium]|nr:hypothetical protein [Saprospiraceae bacterium]
MSSIITLLRTANFGLSLLLAMLVIFYTSIDITGWQVLLGRVHPLLLHLPIGIFVVTFLIYLLRSSIDEIAFYKIYSLLLDLSIFTGFLSALSGLILAASEGENYSDTLEWHKYGG